jgi:hypothetical protein
MLITKLSLAARSRSGGGGNRMRAGARMGVSALLAVHAAVPPRVTGSVSPGAEARPQSELSAKYEDPPALLRLLTGGMPFR